MSGKVLWWYTSPFSICEISILLLLVHRISEYSSYSLVNIGAPQHIAFCLTFWTLPFPKIRTPMGAVRKHTETACKPCVNAGVILQCHMWVFPVPRRDRHKAAWTAAQQPPGVPMEAKQALDAVHRNEVLGGHYLSKTLSLLSVLVGGGVEWLISN